MKILFIGDLHLRINHFEHGVNLLRWIESQVRLHKPDIVCNLGDTFHSHAVLRSEIIKEFKDHIYLSTLNGAKYWYVLGNHDQYKPRDAKYHALQVFKDLPNLTVFDKITELPQLNITMVPYVQLYKDFPLHTNKICITHNTFVGADYGFKREDCGIDAGKVNADVIISGHVHKRQSFGNVIYPGTPCAHNATDVDQSKGLLLFDTATYKQTFIESPFPKWKSLQYEINQSLDIATLHTQLETELDSINKWILKVSGPKAELSAYFKSKKYFDLTTDKNVVVKATPIDSEKQNRIQIKASSTNEIISEYVQKVYSGGADKLLIIQKAQEIIKSLR